MPQCDAASFFALLSEILRDACFFDPPLRWHAKTRSAQAALVHEFDYLVNSESEEVCHLCRGDVTWGVRSWHAPHYAPPAGRVAGMCKPVEKITRNLPVDNCGEHSRALQACAA